MAGPYTQLESFSRYGVNPLMFKERLPTVLPCSMTRILVVRNKRGLHRYQPVRARIHSPDKEFRSALLLVDQDLSGLGGPVISAGLPASPQGSDYLFTDCYSVSGV